MLFLPSLGDTSQNFSSFTRALEGADLESKDNNGRTPLPWAARGGGGAAGGEGRGSGGQGIEWPNATVRAAVAGQEAVVKLLLEKGADLESKDSKWGLTSLFWAILRGYEAVAKLLLENGARLRMVLRNPIMPPHHLGL
jgi:ankyrin repeat protein